MNRSVARREARDEAFEQKKNAVSEAESTISCPSSGCDSSKVCARVGNWFNGGPAGSVVDKEERDDAGVWHVLHRAYVERRLKCDCVSVIAADLPQQAEIEPDEEHIF